jgi:CHAT domain-containing protein/tetratricopeptide (TPR) repeat protein
VKRAVAVVIALALATGCAARDPPETGTGSRADSVIALGEQIYRREEYDSARLFLLPLAERFRASGDSVAEARALTWLGLAAWRLGDYTRAREEQERALKLKLALGLERDLWRSYNGLGLVAWNEGHLMEATARFGEAMAIAERLRDSVGLGSTAGNLGLVYTELGDFEAARSGFVRMREIGRITGSGRVEGNAHTNLGMLDIRVGNPSSALEHLTDALHLYQVVDYATGRQNALGQLGTAYAAMGDRSKALAALDSALTQSRELGLQQDEASNLEAIAEQYRVAGDYARALEVYGQAEALNRALGLRVEIGADLRSKAEMYMQLGDLNGAARNGRDALASHRAASARLEMLADELLLADVEDRAGRRQAADAHLSEASRLANAVGVRISRLSAALGTARIADRRGDPRRVTTVLDAAAPDLAAGGYDTEWEAYALRARAMNRLGRVEDAVANGRKAIAAVERVRVSYGSGLLRTSYVADRSRVYADLAAFLGSIGRTDEAFEVSDGARGRALLERSAAPRGSGTRAAALIEIGALVAQIERFTRGYDQADLQVRGTVAELYERLGRARGAYEQSLARESDSHPGAALIGALPTRAADVRAALGEDEALLEYLVAPDGLTGFVVTRERVTVFHSPVSVKNLKSRVRLARELVSRRDSAGEPVLAALHAALITPARLPATTRRLVVVPHDVLAYLPFAALRDERTGRYLAESYSVVLAPSAMALSELRGRGAREADVGDAIVFAPFPEQLPATAVEADALRRTVGAKLRIGRHASEQQFRHALGLAVPVHAASHGVLNPHNPLFSRIELASGAGGPASDGRLEVHELLDFRIASPLVFLSGCETALGAVGSTDFARGEDFMTLAQAFLYAGAQNVVATLWRVEDGGAAVFAERFYEHLTNSSPAEALAAAQRDLLRDSAYRAPFYWAAYTVSGSGQRAAQERAHLSVRQ